MAITPFHDIPKKVFINRMLTPIVGLFFFCLMGVGLIANTPVFQRAVGPSLEAPFWISAFRHYGHFAAHLTQIPAVCWSRETGNDFQVRQCENYWTSLTQSGLLALAPFLIVGILLMASFENFASLYRQMQRKAEKGQAIFGGTVTRPAAGPQDLFSWFYCLRPIMIELPNKSQLKVYVSLDVAVPNPGETLAVVQDTIVLGEKRYVALLYAPHVAVVRGS